MDLKTDITTCSSQAQGYCSGEGEQTARAQQCPGAQIWTWGQPISLASVQC